MGVCCSFDVHVCVYVHHLQVYPDQSGGHHLPPNCFATCSTDGSVRFWNLDSSLPPQWKNAYSKVCVWRGGDFLIRLHLHALICWYPCGLVAGTAEGDLHRQGCDFVEGPDKSAWWATVHADVYVCTCIAVGSLVVKVLCIRFCECCQRHHQGD